MRTRDEAFQGAADTLSAVRRERDEVAMTGGPAAVAEAAHGRGDPPEHAIAALYQRLRERVKRPGTAA